MRRTNGRNAKQIGKTTGARACDPQPESLYIGVTRRQFLEMAAGSSVLASLPEYTHLQETPAEMPRRMLGNTGEKVSAIGLGGFHLGKPTVSESDAIRIIRTAIDNGIDFLDNCWDYKAVKAKSAWVKLSAGAIAREHS